MRNDGKTNKVQLSQRDRAMLRVIEYFAKFSSVQFVTLLKQNVLRGCRLA